MNWHLGYIALGSNLGDRKTCLDRAIMQLGETDAIQIDRVSSYHETEPVDVPTTDGQPAGAFLNAVAAIRTTLEPGELMTRLRAIEQAAGRPEANRRQKNASRTLDLDLLMYDELILTSPDLNLPHPRMHERAFVLAPLAEIAPNLKIPGRGERTVSEWLTNLG